LRVVTYVPFACFTELYAAEIHSFIRSNIAETDYNQSRRNGKMKT
jgi:hypothetical protein